MVKLYAGLAISALLVAGGYGLINYGRSLERSDHAEKVVVLQQKNAEQSLKIAEFEDKEANNVRKLAEANREKNHAIKTNDHQTAEVKRLEWLIKQEREKSKVENAKQIADAIHYRVISLNAVERVWEAGRICSGLPESNYPSVLQQELPQVSGDGVTELIKYAQGEYCGCATDYAGLLTVQKRTVAECNNPGMIE